MQYYTVLGLVINKNLKTDKMKRYKTKCLKAMINTIDRNHTIVLKQDEENTGMFGSKIIGEQFEKIESVLSKRYIKLPFGIRILV